MLRSNISRPDLQVTLLKLLRAYEAVLLREGLSPADDVHLYSFLLQLALGTQPDWQTRFELQAQENAQYAGLMPMAPILGFRLHDQRVQPVALSEASTGQKVLILLGCRSLVTARGVLCCTGNCAISIIEVGACSLPLRLCRLGGPRLLGARVLWACNTDIMLRESCDLHGLPAQSSVDKCACQQWTSTLSM